jgi:hypothetical protein
MILSFVQTGEFPYSPSGSCFCYPDIPYVAKIQYNFSADPALKYFTPLFQNFQLPAKLIPIRYFILPSGGMCAFSQLIINHKKNQL